MTEFILSVQTSEIFLINYLYYNVNLLSNDREDGCWGFNFLILILPDLKPSLRSESCKNCLLAVFHQFSVRWAVAGPIILLDNNHTHTIQTQPEARKSCWKLHNLATYSTHRWVLPGCVGATMRNFLYLGRIVILFKRISVIRYHLPGQVKSDWL